MEWVAAASSVLSAAAGRPNAPAASTSSPMVNSWLDNSGWTVATGHASAQGGARSQSEGLTAGLSPLMIGAALVGLLIWKKYSR